MRIKHLIILVIVFFFSSCAEKDVELPEGILPEKEFISLMVDVEVMEGVLVYEANIGKKTVGLRDVAFDSILHHYNINDSLFKMNVQYYNQDPKKMSKLFEKVMDSIKNIKESLKNEKNTNS